MNQPRRLVSLVGSAAIGLAVLAGCSSEPSAKRVALDIIESVPGLTDDQRDCMSDRLNDYDNGDLEDLSKANKDVDFAAGAEGDEALQKFQADLAECMTAAGVAETEGTATDDTATDGTTADDTEPSGTEPSGTELG